MKATPMFDARCPACDKPVVGEHAVLLAEPAKLPVFCPHCKISLRVVRGDKTAALTGDQPLTYLASVQMPPVKMEWAVKLALMILKVRRKRNENRITQDEHCARENALWDLVLKGESPADEGSPARRRAMAVQGALDLLSTFERRKEIFGEWT